jgi:hypothetical protein
MGLREIILGGNCSLDHSQLSSLDLGYVIAIVTKQESKLKQAERGQQKKKKKGK